jgi:hypothetical protein
MLTEPGHTGGCPVSHRSLTKIITFNGLWLKTDRCVSVSVPGLGLGPLKICFCPRGCLVVDVRRSLLWGTW